MQYIPIKEYATSRLTSVIMVGINLKHVESETMIVWLLGAMNRNGSVISSFTSAPIFNLEVMKEIASSSLQDPGSIR